MPFRRKTQPHQHPLAKQSDRIQRPSKLPRMKPAAPIVPKHKIDAFVAFGLDWLGWLLAMVLKLGAPRRSRTLRRLVQKAERYVDSIVFIMAIARLNPRPRRLARHPISAPIGFRRITTSRRLLLKHARIRDRRLSLHARVLRLLSALAHPERYIARLVRRCRRGICATRVILCAPPAPRFSPQAPSSVAYADST